MRRCYQLSTAILLARLRLAAAVWALTDGRTFINLPVVRARRVRRVLLPSCMSEYGEHSALHSFHAHCVCLCRYQLRSIRRRMTRAAATHHCACLCSVLHFDVYAINAFMPLTLPVQLSFIVLQRRRLIRMCILRDVASRCTHLHFHEKFLTPVYNMQLNVHHKRKYPNKTIQSCKPHIKDQHYQKWPSVEYVHMTLLGNAGN